MPDEQDLRERVVRLEERLHGAMQVVEGVKLIAEQVHDAHARIDVQAAGMADLEGDLRQAVGDLRDHISSVERRREAASRELEQRQEERTKRVEQSCAELAKRLDATLNARIGSRSNIMVASISAAAGLITLLLGRLFGAG